MDRLAEENGVNSCLQMSPNDYRYRVYERIIFTMICGKLCGSMVCLRETRMKSTFAASARIICPQVRLQNQRRCAFKSRPLQSWSGATPPSLYPMRNAISQRSAVGAVTALQRPRNADEFDLQFIGSGARHGITVPS